LTTTIWTTTWTICKARVPVESCNSLHDSTSVPVGGLEPPRPLEQSILSAPRLPFRHTGAQ
jgi:hypothetical protein